ncbi:hypothetical protein DUI87_20383 [Hirundo rustica rustica]|uniref:Uncharacterized protein n=1 Tax=Hirundo rustica rustica TaxID=333673 RepID=A0A3M0JQS2_HIRRU|nr:hypothetical protein DUI87_20383 [Hirundo rustica rustica]
MEKRGLWEDLNSRCPYLQGGQQAVRLITEELCDRTRCSQTTFKLEKSRMDTRVAAGIKYGLKRKSILHLIMKKKIYFKLLKSAAAREPLIKGEARENRVFWTVWIQWPGTSEPQKYEALVDTGAQCTLMPLEYVGTEPISIAGVTGGSQELTLLEARASLTRKERQKHPVVTGPGAPRILGIDFLWNGYYRDPKGLRWAFGIATVEVEGIKKLNSLPGLSENPSAVGPLKSDGEWRLTVDYRALNEVTPPLSAAVLDMLELQYNRMHASVCLHMERSAVQLEPIATGLETQSPPSAMDVLEKGEAPEHLQYINYIIVWGSTAMGVFEKGEKIIQILLEAGFAIKKSKVKGPAREIQFLGVK